MILSKVKELGAFMFNNFKHIEHIIFQGNSQLQTIGKACFRNNGLEEFIAPPSLRTIESEAFAACEHLKRVILNEGLEVIGTDPPEDLEVYHGAFKNSAV